MATGAVLGGGGGGGEGREVGRICSLLEPVQYHSKLRRRTSEKLLGCCMSVF